MLGPAPEQRLRSSRHCSLSSAFAGSFEPGDQLRIQRTIGSGIEEYALYTVTQLRDEPGPPTLRMTPEGAARLGLDSPLGDAPFEARVRGRLTAEGLTDAQAKHRGEFVERLVDDGVHTRLVVLAPHGGMIEAYTDRQAERVGANLAGVSSWICKGWRPPHGAFERWHISSTELSPRSFAGLGRIADRGFARVLSFHGMHSPGLVIGGLAPLELREQLRAAILRVTGAPPSSIRIAHADEPFAGVHPTNLTNRLSAGGEGGVQLEQSLALRRTHWRAIADAVSEVLG